MDLLPQLSLALNCILIGLASAGLWVWRQDRLERLRLTEKLVKLEADFAGTVAKVAEIHNKTAMQVTALADTVQAHSVAINQTSSRR